MWLTIPHFAKSYPENVILKNRILDHHQEIWFQPVFSTQKMQITFFYNQYRFVDSKKTQQPVDQQTAFWHSYKWTS